MQQITRELARLNPGLVITEGTKHLKLSHHGRLLCILPRRLRTEGLAHNTKTKLRNAGLTVPGSIPERTHR